jgi:hypothetical protein
MSTLRGETNQYQMLRHSALMFLILYVQTDRETDILMPRGSHLAVHILQISFTNNSKETKMYAVKFKG